LVAQSILMNKVLTIIVIFVSFLSSCQKDLRDSNTAPTIITGSDSIYLDTVYYADIRFGVTDTLEIYSYIYDIYKRLTLAKWVPAKPSVYFSDSGSVYFYYISSDTLPYKTEIIRSFDLNRTFDTSTIFHFYDLSGKLIKDSTLLSANQPFAGWKSNGVSITLYSYIANLVLCQNTSDYIYNQPPYSRNYAEKDTSFISSEGNIIKTVFYNSNTGTFKKYQERVITYDNNPISYLNSNIFNSLSSVYGHYSEYLPPADGRKSNNNPISLTIVDYDTLGNIHSINSENHTYTYYDNGFPKTSSYEDPYWQGRIIKYFYKYK